MVPLLPTQTDVPLTQLNLAIANLIEALGSKLALMDQDKWDLIKTYGSHPTSRSLLSRAPTRCPYSWRVRSGTIRQRRTFPRL